METATSAGQERPVVDAEAALRFLAEASTVLAGSLDYATTVKRVAELLVIWTIAFDRALVNVRIVLLLCRHHRHNRLLE